jgi:hypothetical protein
MCVLGRIIKWGMSGKGGGRLEKTLKTADAISKYLKGKNNGYNSNYGR